MSSAYAYGMITPSTVYVLRQDFSFPQPNQYAEVAATHASIGGEAANSAIVLSKLGLRTKLDGNWINPKRAEHVFGLLGRYDIDLSRLSSNEAGGTEEFVIADGESRTVFGNYASFHEGKPQWNEPQPEDVRAADVVCLDPYFREQSRRVAELCVEYGKPYVTLDSRYEDYVAQNAAAVVISHELRGQAYRDREPAQVFARYQELCAGLVIFTFGADELWFARGPGERRVAQPYAIEPIDSTGAGDSFRGAIAYGILQGWADERVIDFASAMAACVCLTLPHALNAPDLDGVLAFMKSAPRRASSSSR